jgi:hypothetical protein
MRNWDDDEIETRARRFRQAMGVDDLDWLDVPTLIYKLKLLLPGVSYLTVEDSDLPEPGGQWNAATK